MDCSPLNLYWQLQIDSGILCATHNNLSFYRLRKRNFSPPEDVVCSTFSQKSFFLSSAHSALQILPLFRSFQKPALVKEMIFPSAGTSLAWPTLDGASSFGLTLKNANTAWGYSRHRPSSCFLLIAWNTGDEGPLFSILFNGSYDSFGHGSFSWGLMMKKTCRSLRSFNPGESDGSSSFFSLMFGRCASLVTYRTVHFHVLKRRLHSSVYIYFSSSFSPVFIAFSSFEWNRTRSSLYPFFPLYIRDDLMDSALSNKK